MFGIERLQAIKELLKEKKSVEVTWLSKELEVSEVTIRRDLDKLEKEGFAAKTYGGAILLEDLGQESVSGEATPTTILPGSSTYDSVGKTAVKLIESGDTIFISGGELGNALARHLDDIDELIVVTNNIEIAVYLFRLNKHKVVIIGGEVDEQTGNVQEYDQLEELLIEKAFFSVDGIDLKFGYTVNEKNEVRLYKQLKDVSRHMILVSVNDIFNRRGLVKLAPLDDVDSIVGEKDMPDNFKSHFYERNIKVHTSILKQD